ncbi:MAG TPA: hypothetical protein VMB34_08185 [Acetobacteraceae bacterium]|nr:hypothetical protein [Acetobacteraceae bacterium]
MRRRHLGHIWNDTVRAGSAAMPGWCGDFSPGSHYAADRVIEAHLYHRVRKFLARRHKMPPRSSGLLRMAAVFGAWVC